MNREAESFRRITMKVLTMQLNSITIMDLVAYKSEMREKIREVMRFSGPRMLFVHPVAAIRHVMETKREKRRLEELEWKKYSTSFWAVSA